MDISNSVSLTSYLLSFGAHIGHLKFEAYSCLSNYILGTRHSFAIFDIQKTVPLIKNALIFFEKLVSNFGQALFCYSGIAVLNTHIRHMFINITSTRNQSFSYWRWAPGCITNYRTVFLRLTTYLFRNASSLWCSKRRDTVGNALSFALRSKLRRNTLLDKVSRNKSFMFRHRFSFLRRYKYASAILSSLYAKMRHSILSRSRILSSPDEKVMVNKNARTLARVHRSNNRLFLRDLNMSVKMLKRLGGKLSRRTRLSAVFPMTVKRAVARRRKHVAQLVHALRFRGMLGGAFRRHMSILYSDAESKKKAMHNCADTERYMHLKSLYEMSLLNIKATLRLRSNLLKMYSSDSSKRYRHLYRKRLCKLARQVLDDKPALLLRRSKTDIDMKLHNSFSRTLCTYDAKEFSKQDGLRAKKSTLAIRTNRSLFRRIYKKGMYGISRSTLMSSIQILCKYSFTTISSFLNSVHSRSFQIYRKALKNCLAVRRINVLRVAGRLCVLNGDSSSTKMLSRLYELNRSRRMNTDMPHLTLLKSDATVFFNAQLRTGRRRFNRLCRNFMYETHLRGLRVLKMDARLTKKRRLRHSTYDIRRSRLRSFFMSRNRKKGKGLASIKESVKFTKRKKTSTISNSSMFRTSKRKFLKKRAALRSYVRKQTAKRKRRQSFLFMQSKRGIMSVVRNSTLSKENTSKSELRLRLLRTRVFRMLRRRRQRGIQYTRRAVRLRLRLFKRAHKKSVHPEQSNVPKPKRKRRRKHPRRIPRRHLWRLYNTWLKKKPLVRRKIIFDQLRGVRKIRKTDLLNFIQYRSRLRLRGKRVRRGQLSYIKKLKLAKATNIKDALGKRRFLKRKGRALRKRYKYSRVDMLRTLPSFISMLIRLFNITKSRFNDFMGDRDSVSVDPDVYFNSVFKRFLLFWRAVIFFKCFRKTLNLPDCLVFFNPDNSISQMNDFSGVNIPIISVVDTITDIFRVTYPIPSNDDSVILLLFYFSLFLNACDVGITTRYVDFY